MKRYGWMLLLLAIPAPAASQHEFHRGSGDDVIAISLPEANRALLVITGNAARENFAVWEYDSQGTRTDLLVNTLDRYSGRLLSGPDAAELEIQATGAWTVAVFQVGAAVERLAAGSTFRGEGDDVVWLEGSPRVATITGNSSRDNFAVWAYDQAGNRIDLLVNTMDDYNGTVRLPRGTLLLGVNAVGRWVVSLR